MHARAQIRQAMATQLTGLVTTGSNVFASRVYPMDDAHLPSLAIYSLAEEAWEDGDVVTSERQFRGLSLEVVARAKEATNLDDTLDEICSEVEAALYADMTLGGMKVKTLRLLGTEIVLAAQEKPVGEARMRWAALYRVNPATPSTLID